MTYTRKELLKLIDKHLANHGPAIQGNREKREALKSLRHDIERGRKLR